MKKLIPLVVITLLTASPILTAQNKKAAKKKADPAMAKVEDVVGLPRVLLIGDSISMGYTAGVRELLKGKANLHRPLTNCGPTTRGIAAIDQWLKTGGQGKKWDVIHFNWGLHDLKFIGADGDGIVEQNSPGSHRQVSPADYEKNLTALVAKLKATNAKLIWRNTTTVPAGCKGRDVGASAQYNAIAAKVMKANDVPTQDLFTVSKERMDELMRPANVHFHDAGNKVLSKLVADRILEELK